VTGSGLLFALLLAAGQHEAQPAPVAPAHEATPAADHEAPSHDAQPAHEAVPPAGGHAVEGEHAAESDHHDPASVLMHHVLDSNYYFVWSKHFFFFALVALIVILIARRTIKSYRDGVPSGMAAAVEALVVFVRDEIAEKNIGHDGRKFVPLLLSFFFFILTAALVGLVPLPYYDSASGIWSISATGATANISVTLALATVSFLAQQWAGISKYGAWHHFKGMVPPGLPAFLLPIMIPVELLGMFSKPFALMIRLFANMLAGHMVITVLLMLIPITAGVSTFMGVSMIPISLGLALFIMMLEVLVAFIQAYIFTLLTSIFIGMYAHPAH
jgi:F-type H+-transporting ATPase subunit a